jgi:hypothetical protein
MSDYVPCRHEKYVAWVIPALFATMYIGSWLLRLAND